MELSPLRKGRITATRARDILTQQFRTKDAVMREMIREAHDLPAEFKGNIATDWGIENEERAGAAYECRTGSMLDRQHFRVHPIFDWLGASYDYVTPHEVVEIKCPYNQIIPANPPEGYLVQLRCEIECDPARDSGHLFYWTPEATRIFYVAGGLRASEIELLREFYQEFIDNLNNPKRCQQYFDPIPRTDDEWKLAAERYLDITQQLKNLETQQEEAKQRLGELSDGVPTTGFGVDVTYKQHKGRVDYSQIPELELIDLEQYRKPPQTIMRVSKTK